MSTAWQVVVPLLGRRDLLLGHEKAPSNLRAAQLQGGQVTLFSKLPLCNITQAKAFQHMSYMQSSTCMKCCTTQSQAQHGKVPLTFSLGLMIQLQLGGRERQGSLGSCPLTLELPYTSKP